MSLINKISCQVTPRALKEPFRTSLRTVTHFDVIEFHLESEDGLHVHGEAVETPAVTGDTKGMILEGLLGPITQAINGVSFQSPLELAPIIAQTFTVASAKAAADMALFNLASAFEEKTLLDFMDSSQASVATDVTIPIADLGEYDAIINDRTKAGFTAYKVKLGMEPTAISIQKIRRIREIVGERPLIRIDPNQAWTVEHCLAFLSGLEKVGIDIDYIEQPTQAVNKNALAQIRRETQVKVMADESCFDAKDLLELIDLQAVDLVNLKLLKCGGITPALDMERVAREAGIEVYVGSMMEADGGVYAAGCLASVISPLKVHDLDASWWSTDSDIEYSNGEVILR